MAKDFDPVALSQGIDQFEAMIRDTAKIWATYYQKLRSEGMPDDKAFDLVRDLHAFWWERALKLRESYE
jgi:hypothetical protein